MPSVHDIVKESDPSFILKNYIKNLSNKTKRNTIIYYSGWLNGPNKEGTSINDFDKNGFMSVVHELDFNKGLDLLLHTPGGSISATESIIDYLHEIFDGDIRAIIPQMAMSGGTMIACSCKEIIMGKQSSLGPTDPQLGGFPAHAVIKEFTRAKSEVHNDPSCIPLWQPIIAQYSPAFIEQSYKAIDLSNEILERILKNCMFKEEPENVVELKLNKIKKKLTSYTETKTHDRHINPKECLEIGLKVLMMEDKINDNGNEYQIQDEVLSIHHACMNLMNQSPISKVMMNNNDKAFIQTVE